MNELDYWKTVAAYFADCHAANLEIGLKKATSKYERGRLYLIMQKAEALMAERVLPPALVTTPERVVERLRRNAAELAETYPEVKES